MKRYCIKTCENKFICVDDIGYVIETSNFSRYTYHVRTWAEADQFIYAEKQRGNWRVCEFEVPEVFDSKG